MQNTSKSPLPIINRWSIPAFLFFLIYFGSMPLSNSLRYTLGENYHDGESKCIGECYRYDSRFGTIYITKTERNMVDAVDYVGGGSLMVALLFALKLARPNPS